MLYEAHAPTRRSCAPADPVLVRPAEPTTRDRASVVALGADGAIVGRATLSRLYGARGEVQLELAPTSAIALALIDKLEGSARGRGLARVELDPKHLSDDVIAALRRSRPTCDDHRSAHQPFGEDLPLTWPITKSLVTS